MQFDLEPGDFVINPKNKEWGIGQIQSVIKNKITVNFQNSGKQVIDVNYVILERKAVQNTKKVVVILPILLKNGILLFVILMVNVKNILNVNFFTRKKKLN